MSGQRQLEPPARDNAVLAAVAAAAVLLVLPVVVVTSGVHLWMVVALVVAAALVYARRDSVHGLIGLAVVGVVWLVARPGGGSAWSLAVALLMFTTHACLALQAAAPPGAVFSRDIVSRWLRRCGVVAAVTAAVYVAALGTRTLPRSPAPVLLAVSLAVTTALVLLLRQETLRGAAPAPNRPDDRSR